METRIRGARGSEAVPCSAFLIASPLIPRGSVPVVELARKLLRFTPETRGGKQRSGFGLHLVPPFRILGQHLVRRSFGFLPGV